MENSRCFCPHFNSINYQKISSIKLISLILIFSCSSDSLFSLRLLCCCLWEFPYSGYLATAYLRITSLRLPCSCLCENFLNKVASQLLTWEYPHWGCLAAPYLKISSLRLPCDCFLENFLIEAALGLIAWKFPHEGYLFIETSFLRILYWGYMIEEACLRLTQESSLF